MSALAIGVLLVATTIACTSEDSRRASVSERDQQATSSTSTTAAARAPEPDPVLLAVGDRLDPDGVLPVPFAAQLFAATVAPLPGVEPATLPSPLPADIAGMATRRLLAPDVDPTLRQAVLAAIEPTEGEEEVEIAPGRRRELGEGGTEITGSEPSAEELAAEIESIIAELERRTGHELRIGVRPRIVADRVTGGDAVASPVGPPERPTSCRIALPRGLFSSDEASVTSTLAHEVWHCFQLDVDPDAFATGPAWLIEGQAEWAGEAFAGGSESSASRWDTWLGAVTRSLLTRSYDAIGLYAVANQTGADPWQTMLPMLSARGAAAIERLFGMSAPDAMRGVAQALVRAPAVSAEWESTGPGITETRGAPVLAAQPDGAEVSETVGRFGVLPVVLTIRRADVLEVAVSGGDAAAIAVPEAGTVVVSPGTKRRWCMRPEGCVCPDGRELVEGGRSLPRAGPGEGAAGIASLGGGTLTVRARLASLDEECEQNDIVGQWSIEVTELLQRLAGSSAGFDCSGPMLLTFGADGSFVAAFDATCQVAGERAAARGQLSATYRVEGSSIVFENIQGAGSMNVRGLSMPLPVIDGYRQALGSPNTFAISGDQLTITFTNPSVGTVSITYTRVA